MIKTIINKFIKTALDELFVDAPSVQLSMGADMFSDSNINLKNLTLRKDLPDIYMQPFTLVSGHVGSLMAEGIAELALGGKLRFQAENLFLLFSLDEKADPEKIQTMKKLLIELQGPLFTVEMLQELIKKLHGVDAKNEVDLAKKRKVIYNVLDYIYKGVFITIKNIHIRFEFFSGGSNTTCDVIGIKLPFIKINPAAPAQRPDSLGRLDPAFSVQLKAAQVYIDYGRPSYDQGTSELTKQAFERDTKDTMHTSFIVPTDLDIVMGLEIKRKSGTLSPKMVVNIPVVKVAVDVMQVKALSLAVQQTMKAKKTFQQKLKIQKIFRPGFPQPRICQVGGVKVLPSVHVRNLPYPSEIDLEGVQSKSDRLVGFMKERVGERWATMLWKHLIRLVIHDIRQLTPLGKWREVARLNAQRRNYVFMYAKLLHPASNAPDSPLVYNVHANLPASKFRDLLEVEMALSCEAIRAYRALAYMVVMVAQVHAGGANSKVFLTWGDILKIYAELLEAGREAGKKLFERGGGDGGEIDETQSTTDSDGGASSVYSYSLQTRTPVKSLSNGKSSRPSLPPTPTTADKKAGLFGSWLGSSGGAGGKDADEYDKKVMNKMDFSVFGSRFSFLGMKADRAAPASNSVSGNTPSTCPLTPDLEASMKQHTNAHTRPPGTRAVAWGEVVAGVRGVLGKYQSPITMLPPDLLVKVEKVTAGMRTPLSSAGKDGVVGVRMNLITLSMSEIVFSLLFSPSFSNAPSTSTHAQSHAQTTTLPPSRGWEMLSGALIQVKGGVKALAVTVAVPPLGEGVNVWRATSLPPAVSKKAMAEQSGAKAEGTLTSGLPAYPIEERDDNSDESDHQEKDPKDGDVSTDIQDKVTSKEEWKTIPTPKGGEVAYIAGQTVMYAVQKKQEEELRKKMHNQKVFENFEKKQAEKSGTIAQNGLGVKDMCEDVMANRAVSGAGDVYKGVRYEQRDVFASAPGGDSFLTVCLMLDLDKAGEGAGDLQVGVGGGRMDLSLPLSATLLSPLLLSTAQAMGVSLGEMGSAMGLSMQDRVLIDWEGGVCTVRDRGQGGWAFNYSNPDNQEDEDEDENLEKSSKNQIVVENTASDTLVDSAPSPLFPRNLAEYLNLLQNYLPLSLSFTLTSAPLLVQGLEGLVLRDLIHKHIHNAMDRVARRTVALPGGGGMWALLADMLVSAIDPAALQTQEKALGVDKKSGQYGSYRNIRAWGSRKLPTSPSTHLSYPSQSPDPDLAPSAPSLAQCRCRAVLPALSVTLLKTVQPLPSLQVMFGKLTVLQIPMSDETLCYYLAYVLAQNMPLYTY